MLIVHIHRPYSLATTRQAFQVLDRDRSNFIEREELKEALTRFGLAENISPEKLDLFIAKFDSNKDGSFVHFFVSFQPTHIQVRKGDDATSFPVRSAYCRGWVNVSVSCMPPFDMIRALQLLGVCETHANRGR